jgi:hypothetical protein
MCMEISAFDLCSIFRSGAIRQMVKETLEVALFNRSQSSCERKPMTLNVRF